VETAILAAIRADLAAGIDRNVVIKCSLGGLASASESGCRWALHHLSNVSVMVAPPAISAADPG
jgi:hypothetical protein